jgi:hypothetical protein
MTMITQAVDPHNFIRKARQIKARMPILLSRWGLLPKFKRWRLAQDPDTGTVVLFGVLNNKYIAMHTTIPFSNYFDPRLMRDLAAELHVPVVSSANDGLRYAFILERGQIGFLPAPVELLTPDSVDQAPPAEGQKVLIEIRPAPPIPNHTILADEHTILHQRLDRFLKITEALDTLGDATPQPVPDALLIAEAEFYERLAEYEASRNPGPLQAPAQG